VAESEIDDASHNGLYQAAERADVAAQRLTANLSTFESNHPEHHPAAMPRSKSSEARRAAENGAAVMSAGGAKVPQSQACHSTSLASFRGVPTTNNHQSIHPYGPGSTLSVPSGFGLLIPYQADRRGFSPWLKTKQYSRPAGQWNTASPSRHTPVQPTNISRHTYRNQRSGAQQEPLVHSPAGPRQESSVLPRQQPASGPRNYANKSGQYVYDFVHTGIGNPTARSQSGTNAIDSLSDEIEMRHRAPYYQGPYPPLLPQNAEMNPRSGKRAEAAQEDARYVLKDQSKEDVLLRVKAHFAQADKR
jgi:hypothetical protein